MAPRYALHLQRREKQRNSYGRGSLVLRPYVRMHPRPGYWAAVRLVEFANLLVTRENWESLFQVDARDMGWVPGQLESSRDRARRYAQTLSSTQVLDLAPRPLPPMPVTGGLLWKQFVAGVRRHGTPPTRPEVFLR